MDVKTSNTESGKELFLSGRFMFSDNEAFRDVIRDMDGDSGTNWVLNLKGLEFIDSAGLGMLLIARDAASKNQVALSLRGAQGQVQHMLQVSKFNELITCE